MELNQNVVSTFFARLPQTDRMRLLSMCLKIKTNEINGCHDEMQNGLATLEREIVAAESRTGMRILDTRGEQARYDLLMLTGIVFNVFRQVKKEVDPVKGRITFESVEEADAWLAAHPTVTVDSLDINTSSNFIRTKLHAVALTYTDHGVATGYRYGVVDRHTFGIFKKDDAKFRKYWGKKCPNTEICMYRSTLHRRVLLGQGAFLLLTTQHFYTVYRVRTGAPVLAQSREAYGARLMQKLSDRFSTEPRTIPEQPRQIPVRVPEQPRTIAPQPAPAGTQARPVGFARPTGFPA